ncbi:hypothetical protein Bbelb_395860 [Branchiostoma belcheri]|nr:hypothetical protein Bbelb_395860 [Branchiostoma belcheri]
MRTRLPAPRVTEHWNDPVRNALLRDFGTCYPVVNVPRALVASAEWNSALAIQCGERPPSSGKRVLSGSLAPENECRVKIQLWNSSPDGVSALEQSRFCTRIPVRSFLPHRAPSADATFPLSSALGGHPSRWKTPHEGDGGPAPASASRGLGAGAAVDCLSSVRQRAPHARGYNSGDPRAPGTFRGDVAAVEPVAALRPEEVQRVRTPRRRPIDALRSHCRGERLDCPGASRTAGMRRAGSGSRGETPRGPPGRGAASPKSNRVRTRASPPEGTTRDEAPVWAHDAIEGETDPQPDVAPGRTRGRRRQRCRPSVKDGERAEGLGVAPRTGTRREDRCAPRQTDRPSVRRGSIAPALLLKTSGSGATSRGRWLAGDDREQSSPSAQRRPWTAGRPLEVRRLRTGHSSARPLASSQRPRRRDAGAGEEPSHLGPAVRLNSTPFRANPRLATPLRQDIGAPTCARPPKTFRREDLTPSSTELLVGGWLAGSACVVGNDGRNGVCARQDVPRGLPGPAAKRVGMGAPGSPPALAACRETAGQRAIDERATVGAPPCRGVGKREGSERDATGTRPAPCHNRVIRDDTCIKLSKGRALSDVACIKHSKGRALSDVACIKLSKGRALSDVACIKHSKGRALSDVACIKLSKGRALSDVACIKHSKGRALSDVACIKLSKGRALSDVACIRHCKGRALSDVPCIKHCKGRALSDVACIKHCEGRALSDVPCIKYCKRRALSDILYNVLSMGAGLRRLPCSKEEGEPLPPCAGHVRGRSATRRYAAFPRPGTFGFCPVSDEGVGVSAYLESGRFLTTSDSAVPVQAAAGVGGALACAGGCARVPPSTGKVPSRRKEGAAR